MASKLSLDICKLTCADSSEQVLRVYIKIGEVILKTEKVHQRRGTFAFLEKHLVQVPQTDPSGIVQLSVLSETNRPLAQITVFYSKFKTMREIELEGVDKAKFRITYSLRENELEPRDFVPAHTPLQSHNPEDELFSDEAKKMALLKMGVLLYSFTQRLDPLVYLYARTTHLLGWISPMLTVGTGLLLTLLLLNLKTALLCGGALLYFSQDYIFRQLSTVHRLELSPTRLMAPEENTVLLQKMLQGYISAYDSIAGLLFRHDKTLLVNGIKILCKMSLLLMALLFFFRVEYLVVFGIWTVLLGTSPASRQLGSILKPGVVLLVSEYDRFMVKIASGFKSMLRSSVKVQEVRRHLVKEFYLYHYERWNLFKGWIDDNPKFSDQDSLAEVIMKKEPPLGWQWISGWQVDPDTDPDSDEYGYQYSNDFMSAFLPRLGLATRRRRKWRRRCAKMDSS